MEKINKILVNEDTGEVLAKVTDREDKSIDQLLESLKRDVGELMKRSYFRSFDGSIEYNVEISDDNDRLKIVIYKD